MRFVEDRSAGYGVRLFRNLDPPPDSGRPRGSGLPWSTSVRQVGTRRTGQLDHVIVLYHRGRRRRFAGPEANEILRTVQKHRSDAAPS